MRLGKFIVDEVAICCSVYKNMVFKPNYAPTEWCQERPQIETPDWLRENASQPRNPGADDQTLRSSVMNKLKEPITGDPPSHRAIAQLAAFRLTMYAIFALLEG